jgi:hypothetical protein
LLRRAVALYSERFPTFFKVSLLFGSPLVLGGLVQFTLAVLAATGVISRLVQQIAGAFLVLCIFVLSIMSSAMTIGVTIRLVTQFLLAPLRPIKLRPAFVAIKERFKPFALTILLSMVLWMGGTLFLIVPGVIFYIHFSLVAPVVVMERLSGRAALARSWALVRRSRRTVILVLLVQFLIPLAVTIAFNIPIAVVAGAIESRHNVPPWVAQLPDILKAIPGSLVSPVVGLFTTPLVAIFTALLYLKTRLAGGESLAEVLEEIDDREVPRTKWQQRMRQRLVLTPVSGEERMQSSQRP